MLFEVPEGEDPIQVLISSAPMFDDEPRMKAALLSVADNLRQADLIPTEPLGLFGYITAEEEAAAFLYYALIAKGYGLPDHGKLHDHKEKAKVLLFAMVIETYFFRDLTEQCGFKFALTSHDSCDRIECFMIIQHDNGLKTKLTSIEPLGMVRSRNQNDMTSDSIVEGVVQDVLGDTVPRGGSLKHQVNLYANRRNLCLYGDPANKLKPTDGDAQRHKFNCLAMLAFGFLVFQSEKRSHSMDALVANCCETIWGRPKPV